MGSFDDISLDRIYLIEDLTIRAINVCLNADLNSLKSILDFYKTYNSFLKFQNCGVKTNNELVAFCKKYANIYPSDQNTIIEINNYNPLILDIFNNNDVILEKLSLFNTLQVALFNEYYWHILSFLYPKASRTFAYKMGLSSPIEVFSVFLKNEFSYYHIHKTVISDIKEITVSLKKQVEFLEMSSTKELILEYIKLILKKNINKNIPNNIQPEIEKIFDKNDNVKLFKLINLLVEFSEIIPEDKYLLFFHLFSNLNDETLSFVDICKKLNRTRERIRQKKVKLEYDIINYFEDIIKVLINNIVNYNIELRTVNIIESAYADKINENENVAFNLQFFNKIFSDILYIKDTELSRYETIYGMDKTKDGIKSQNSYLIKKAIFDSFDFREFIKDVNKRDKNIKGRSYEFDFSEYLQSFLLFKKSKYFDEIQYICKTIILKEFNLKINQEGLLIFRMTLGINIEDYCIEILEDAGIPLKIDKINEQIKLKYNVEGYRINLIRYVLTREKKIFIFFGRSSTYGLKKWENNELNIKGGTIRDIVVEYLKMHETPQHITAIHRYVAKYRKTSLLSIQRNIVTDTYNRFVFFKYSHVGISGREYQENSIIKKYQRDSWYERYNELILFINNNNNKMPKTSKKNKKELSLYSFYKTVKRAYKNGRLDADKIELYESINSKYVLNKLR